MLQIKKLTKMINDKVVFENLSYHFENKIYQLQASNGTGKSVLLRILAGIDPKYEGERVTDIPKQPNILFLDDQGIGVPFLNILDNVKVASKMLKLPLDLKYVEPLYQEAALETGYAASSLGMQAKVGLALLFSDKPFDLIILDESLSALDKVSKALILARLRQIALMQTCPIIVVSHSDQLSDARMIKLTQGGIEDVNG